MLLISHRGNVKGRFEEFENSPSYIDKAIELGYDVEVDIRYISEVLYLGHDLLTSNRDIWAFPGKQPIRNSIAVLPELYNDTIEKCKGICSDNIENYKK